jgi:hypothetical protein
MLLLVCHDLLLYAALPTREPRCTVHFVDGVIVQLGDCCKEMFSPSAFYLAP